jgi:enoyl-CoA hydratase/carnithine racemase
MGGGTEEHADGALLVRSSPGRMDIVFNRPERPNAFTSGTYAALLEVCAALREDRSTRVVVLRGPGGRAFA